MQALQRIKLGLGGLLRQLRAMREMEATERQETRWEVEQQWPPLKARLQEQMEDIMSKRMVSLLWLNKKTRSDVHALCIRAQD